MKKYIIFAIIHLICFAPPKPISSEPLSGCGALVREDPYLAQFKNIQPATKKEFINFIKDAINRYPIYNLHKEMCEKATIAVLEFDKESTKHPSKVNFPCFITGVIMMNITLEIIENAMVNADLDHVFLEEYKYFLFISKKTCHILRQIVECKSMNASSTWFIEIARKMLNENYGIVLLSDFSGDLTNTERVVWKRDKLNNLIVLPFCHEENNAYCSAAMAYHQPKARLGFIIQNNLLFSGQGLIFIQIFRHNINDNYSIWFYGGTMIDYNQWLVDSSLQVNTSNMQSFKLKYYSQDIYFIPFRILNDFQNEFMKEITNREDTKPDLLDDIVSYALGLSPNMQTSDSDAIDKAEQISDKHSQTQHCEPKDISKTYEQELAESAAIIRAQQKERREYCKARTARFESKKKREYSRQSEIEELDDDSPPVKHQKHEPLNAANLGNKNELKEKSKQMNDDDEDNPHTVSATEFNNQNPTLVENNKNPKFIENLQLQFIEKDKGRETYRVIAQKYIEFLHCCEKAGLKILPVSDNGSHFTIKIIAPKGDKSKIITLVRLHGAKTDLSRSEISNNFKQIIDAIEEIIS